MGVLTKFKRDGRSGFEELVLEMEQLSSKAFDLRMAAIKEEDPDYADSLIRSIFTFNEFLKLKDQEICELISHVKPLNILAISLYKVDEKLLNHFLKNMEDRVRRDFKEIHDDLTGITVGGRQGMQQKIIGIARSLEAKGVFTLKKFQYWNESTKAA